MTTATDYRLRRSWRTERGVPDSSGRAHEFTAVDPTQELGQRLKLDYEQPGSFHHIPTKKTIPPRNSHAYLH